MRPPLHETFYSTPRRMSTKIELLRGELQDLQKKTQ